MPRTVRVVFGLPILFTTVTKTWRAFMWAYLHGQPSLPTAGSFAWTGLHTNKDNWSVARVWITFSKIVWRIYPKHTTWISRVSLRVAPSSSFCSLSFLPNGNHTNLPLEANCEYLQKFLSLYPFLHRGQKPWTDLTMAVPVSDHAWQQTMRKASR